KSGRAIRPRRARIRAQDRGLTGSPLKRTRSAWPSTSRPKAVDGSRRCFRIHRQCYRGQKSVRVGTVSDSFEADHGSGPCCELKMPSPLCGVRLTLRCLGQGSIRATSDIFGKEKLSGMGKVSARIFFALGGAAQVNLHVNTDRAARIPTGIERFEFGNAQRIAMPDVQGGVFERRIAWGRPARRAVERQARSSAPGPLAVL